MKKFLLIFLIPINAVFSQQNDYKKESEEVFTHIRNREFDKASANFDSSVSARIDTARLRQAWDNMLRLSGAFVKVLETTSDHQPNYDVVIQHSQFEKKKIDFKVVYGTNKKIKGISFLPGEPKETYKLPSYDKPDLINERSLFLLNGPIRLPGVMTNPKKDGRHPVVILVHGSGPNDKDETVGATKIFKDLARGLAAKGISVYRYDKRNRLYAAKMVKDKSVTIQEESIQDAIAAINLMKSDSTVDTTAIYLCGHSLGGMILPRIAQGTNVKGLIFMAPNARPLEDMLYDQAVYLLSLDTTGKDHSKFLDSLMNETKKIKGLKKTDTDTTFIFHLPPGYWLDLKSYDAIKAAQNLKMPMFFIQGERDYQVTKSDFDLWKNGIKNPEAKFKLYPDLNHFFISGSGKSTPTEYGKSSNVDESVINDISNWILSGGK